MTLYVCVCTEPTIINVEECVSKKADDTNTFRIMQLLQGYKGTWGCVILTKYLNENITYPKIDGTLGSMSML